MPLDSQSWQARYDEGKTGWDRGGPSPMLLRWLEGGTLEPCRILIPGCGNGHEAVELASRGFDVTAIDFAPTPVQRLQNQLANIGHTAQVIQVDAFSYNPDEPFDAIYEQTFLCAIDPALRDDYVQKAVQWLKPNGKLFALFMQCDHLDKPGPPFHCSIDEMRQLFSGTPWDWPELAAQRVDHPMGIHELAVLLTRK